MENHVPTLVLMAGLPGAGKTTLAFALGHELQWHVIDKDTYKEVLLSQGVDEVKAGIAAYELSFEVARSVLVRQHGSVILDSAALQKFILEHALLILRSIPGAQLKVIFCVADRDLRNKRLRERVSQPATIRVDPETIADYLQYFEHLPSNKLTLYTINPFDECLAAARDYVKNRC